MNAYDLTFLFLNSIALIKSGCLQKKLDEKMYKGLAEWRVFLYSDDFFEPS